MLFRIRSLSERESQVEQKIQTARNQLKYATGQMRVWNGLLRRVTFAKVVQGSNSVEGFNVTFDDAVAAVDAEEPLETEAKSDTWSAITGYRDAMTYVLQLADDPHFNFSEDLIRGLHFMMMRHDLKKNPGRWRPGAIYVKNEMSKKIVYEGPEAGKLPSLMAEFVESLRSKEKLPPMIRAALAHLNLTMIHPFSDGNGRMARIIQTLVLAREGILGPEFCSIEEYLGRETQAYYDVLSEVGAGAWHPERDARPWVKFCLKAHYRQANRLIRRTEFFRRLFDEVEALSKTYDLHERTVPLLAEAAIGLKVRNSRYRAVADISLNLASRDLKLLADRGLLKPVGERRGRVYQGSPELQNLAKKIRLPMLDDDPFKSEKSEQKVLPGLDLH